MKHHAKESSLEVKRGLPYIKNKWSPFSTKYQLDDNADRTRINLQNHKNKDTSIIAPATFTWTPAIQDMCVYLFCQNRYIKRLRFSGTGRTSIEMLQLCACISTPDTRCIYTSILEYMYIVQWTPPCTYQIPRCILVPMYSMIVHFAEFSINGKVKHRAVHAVLCDVFIPYWQPDIGENAWHVAHSDIMLRTED